VASGYLLSSEDLFEGGLEAGAVVVAIPHNLLNANTINLGKVPLRGDTSVIALPVTEVTPLG
jgi:hypothetical protein